ncbi:MAG TPA: FecR family protein [Candidatus Dormibacteraeota bacterium]|nr:FecR family protein [Candidatus Dormibacteraeota bacterium]
MIDRCVRLAALFVLLCASAAVAEDVGSVASTRGEAEIGRGGAFTPATVGATVQLGDELRTGDGQMRVVFRDDSVIDLAEKSSLTVDTQVFDPGSSRFSSLMRLAAGKARALVSQVYGTPGSSYEIQTPTAVAGVRGTTFLIAYDPTRDATDVIGIDGRIMVRSLADVLNNTVYVTASEGTSVTRGMAPTKPEPVDPDYMLHESNVLQPLAVGGAGGGGVAAGAGVKAGNVPPPDRAPSSGSLAGQTGRDEMKNAGDVAGQPPAVIDNRGQLGVP